MSRIIRTAAAAATLTLLLTATARSQALAVWPKWHLDAANSGWNSQETGLTVANVNTATFHRQWQAPVDGQVYAEPLYVAGVKLSHGNLHDLVYVATEHDSVYALDAKTGAIVWQTSLGTSVPTSVVGCYDLAPEYGITSTPVIDVKGGNLYVCAKTYEGSAQIWRIHCLGLTDGAEQHGWPTEVAASVSGSSGPVVFDPRLQLSRCGLVLEGRTLYVTFGSHCDIGLNNYHGWVLGYDTKGPSKAPKVWNSTPDGSGTREAAAGIWMSGASPAQDPGGDVFVITGNGPFDIDLGGQDAGDAFVRLQTRGGRTLTFSGLPTDYFSPSNQAYLDSVDADLGSGGQVALNGLPGTSTPDLLVGGGKDGLLRVLDQHAMGGFTGRSNPNAPNNVVQEVGGFPNGFWSSPATYDNGVQRFVYVNAVGDALKQFSVGVAGSGQSALTLVAASGVGSGYPSSTPVVSSNGNQVGTGIVWMLNRATNALHAFDAANVATELWNSNMTGGPDTFGGVVKFTVPTVANGRVFVGSNAAVAAFGPR